MITGAGVDARELEQRVKDVYQAVAERPHESYHFEMGRGLAERLGYPRELLDRVPEQALDSFAGVGYFLDLGEPIEGDHVLDLGSGSGTDTFAAAALVGGAGHVTGVDMTDAQLAKAEDLRVASGLANVEFVRSYIEELPLSDASVNLVISNGVVNLSADKAAVFREAARVLAPGGRLALADIVSERPLPEAIVCNAELWAACVGGASQIDDYLSLIEEAGLHVETVRDNTTYAFLSGSAQSATDAYGIRSVSLLAVKPIS
ncbi:MAG: methyltransferase domain-containing protein [Mycobacteriales bacterium]